jgi:hypothetical protein
MKESYISVPVFTTTDGKEFAGSDRKEVLKKAEEHQHKIDKEKAKEKISIALWKKFGLPLKYYESEFCPHDPGEEEPKGYKDTCEKVKDIFAGFGADLYGCGEEPYDWEEFTNLIIDIFADYMEECKIVMSVINKCLPKNKIIKS